MRRSLLAVVLALATVVAVPLGATAGTRVLGVTPGRSTSGRSRSDQSCLGA